MRPIVFLHIPKTAGQTIHNELRRVLGDKAISPIRVHHQAPKGAAQMPEGYRVYSGHLDWDEVDHLSNPFVFTVLRDPRERIASFYLYLLTKAERMSACELEEPQHTGLRMALTRSADDYFFAGDAGWKAFIKAHYDNFYCRYLATRKIVSSGPLCLETALRNAQHLSGIYTTTSLDVLQKDLKVEFGIRVRLMKRFDNVGRNPSEARWPQLLARMEKDSSRSALEKMVSLDDLLLERLNLAV